MRVPTQQNCEPSPMTDAELVRAVYPRHTMKRLARAMGAPLDTARHWLYRKMSGERRREMAKLLLAEFDRQDREERAAVRQHLAEMAGMDAEMERDHNSAIDRATNATPRPQEAAAPRPMAGTLRRRVAA